MSLIRTASGHSGQGHERADLDVVGCDVVLAAPQALGAVDREHVGANPRMSAPILTSRRARSCTWGSQAALPSSVVPGVSAAAISAFSVAMTEGSSMNTSPARSPARELDVASHLDLGPHRPEGVQVRIQAPTADHVAARRRHLGVPEAGQQRLGEQERRADALGQALVGRRAHVVHGGAAQPHLVVRPPVDLGTEVLEERDHRVHVPDSRQLQHDLSLGEQGGGKQGQGAVLVAGRDHRPDSGTPPSMTNFSMGAPPPGPQEGSAAGLG